MHKIKKLNCGLTMVMEKIPYVQSVTLGIWIKTGSVDEEPEISGISHFIEHMMFKGTESRTARQIAEDIDKIGGQINAFTSKESTCYYVKSLSSNIHKASDVLLDMMIHSKFDPVEIEKERKVVFEEIKMVEDSPEDDVQDRMYEMIFAGNPLSNSILGTTNTLNSIDHNKIVDFIEKEYVLDHIVVSVAGNFNEEEICELFEGKLSSLRGTKQEKKYESKPYQASFFSKVKDIEQSHLCFATTGLPMGHKHSYTLAILNNIMGGSMSSRLFQNIREEKGMAYSVYSYTASYQKQGMYAISAGVAHDKIEDTIGAIAEELNLLKKSGITKEELEISKEQLKGSHIFSLENTASRMVSLGRNQLILGQVKTPEEVIDEINRITMDDIALVTDIITNLDNYCGVLASRRELDLSALVKERFL